MFDCELKLSLSIDGLQSHSANIIALDDDVLLATWFAGTRENASDVSVYFSRFDVRNHCWASPVKLSSDLTRAEQNPSLFLAPNGHLWIVWMAQTDFDASTSQVISRQSPDGGHTWSQPREIRGPRAGDEFIRVRHPIVLTPSNAWILPIYICQKRPGLTDRSAVLVSTDEGSTWQEFEISGSKSLTQMNIIPLSSEHLIGFFRCRYRGFVHNSESHDGGRQWSKPEATTIPNFNSSMQVIKLRSSELIMAHNALQDRASEADRHIMSRWRRKIVLSRSTDEGRTWKEIHCLVEHNDTSSSPALNTKIELSYPSLLQAGNGDIHVLYTDQRVRIGHHILRAT